MVEQRVSSKELLLETMKHVMPKYHTVRVALLDVIEVQVTAKLTTVAALHQSLRDWIGSQAGNEKVWSSTGTSQVVACCVVAGGYSSRVTTWSCGSGRKEPADDTGAYCSRYWDQ
eukprot:6408767-Amphidinium_carterae.1